MDHCWSLYPFYSVHCIVCCFSKKDGKLQHGNKILDPDSIKIRFCNGIKISTMQQCSVQSLVWRVILYMYSRYCYDMPNYLKTTETSAVLIFFNYIIFTLIYTSTYTVIVSYRSLYMNNVQVKLYVGQWPNVAKIYSVNAIWLLK